MELRRLTLAELSQYLEGRTPGLQDLEPADRDSVVRMARRLAEQGIASRFILSAVRDTVDLMRAPGVPPDLERPASVELPPADDRQQAARRLKSYTQATLREARAARRSNEIRHMRGVLRGIDRGHLRETLGDEGESLCREIDTVLSRLSLPVRRGRPRSQRIAA